jgi:hypothetical protein
MWQAEISKVVESPFVLVTDRVMVELREQVLNVLITCWLYETH